MIVIYLRKEEARVIWLSFGSQQPKEPGGRKGGDNCWK